MYWYFAVLKKYAVFSGRASRQEYWMFMLINVIIGLTLGLPAIVIMISSETRAELSAAELFSVYRISWLLNRFYRTAVSLPSLAVLVRRLHDTGKSGYWFFLIFVPVIGAIVLLYWLAKDSQPGINQYGPNPKENLSLPR